MKKVLLISNKVMHYRIPVYNYFFSSFKKKNWIFHVMTNEVQKKNPHPIKFHLKEKSFNFFEYKREIRKLSPDVIIIFLHLKDKIFWPLIHWLKFNKIPIAFWTKGANLDRPNDKLSLLLYKYTHFFFDALILYSEFEKRLISKKFHHKVFVANNTLNFHDFPDISLTKEEIKKEFGIPFKKVVLSVGRMGEGGGRKRIDHLIKIFQEINDDDIGLVIVGSGLTDDLRKQINRKNILYLGEIYDPEHIKISKLFKAADVFSIPGHIGLGINQAFYWGLPVVTEDVLQPPEIHYLKNNRNGFLVPNNDLIALKEKILLLLRNDELRKRFSQNAREDILKNGSIENMFNGFWQCVSFLSEKKHTRSSLNA